MDSNNIETKYVDKKIVDTIFDDLEVMGKNCDQTTILWRKKYLPHFSEVKKSCEEKWKVIGVEE